MAHFQDGFKQLSAAFEPAAVGGCEGKIQDGTFFLKPPATRKAKKEKGDFFMAKVVKVIELLAQSDKSWEDAAHVAVSEASKTLRNIRAVYIKNFQAVVENGKIAHYRVDAKVSFEFEGKP